VSEIIKPNINREIDPDAMRRDPVYLDTVERIWSSLRTYVD
jgi:NitT/TauT family transport system ATP-binding protein